MQRIQKTIAEFIDKERAPIPIVGPDERVAAAMAEMKDKNSHAVLIVDGHRVADSGHVGQILGIFTSRDFLNRVAAAGLDPAAVTTRAVMTAAPEVLCPHDSIAYAINRMSVGGFRNIPIVDHRGDGEGPQRILALLDIRAVIAHLSDVLSEVAEARVEDRSWTDIGGG